MENELEVVNIRLVKEPSLYSEQTLDSPQAVVELMAKELSQYDREVFCILNMKNNGQVINMNLVSVGTINASLVILQQKKHYSLKIPHMISIVIMSFPNI